MSLKTILAPATYHGTNKKPPFFEGWYYKFVSVDESYKVAVIPGVILGKDAHAFIQVLNGSDGTTAYHQFTLDQFHADPPRFYLEIGDNYFDGRRVFLDIDRPEGQIKGEIQLGPLNPWPVTLPSPGIMGWYAWVPYMECYHGVLSFSHPIKGSLTLNREVMEFNSGLGYIEKDWGQSFPSAWVWFQSNHFSNISACVTASIAIIPWLGYSFRGFIVGFWLDGQLYRFATYNGSKIESFKVSDAQVEIVLRNRSNELCLTASRFEGGLLRGPTRVDMGKRVLETLNALIKVKLTTLEGKLLFEGEGKHAGLEVVGDIPRLLQG